MIFTDRTIIVQKGISSINDTIILYRGDKEVEIRFTLNEGSPFKFGSGASPNIIEKTEAAYGQLIIKRPNDLPAVFSEIAPTNGGKIIFTITAEMIDEITEVGNYTFQIRLFDESRNSRATLPEVVNGIEIREPIATEDISDTNEVGIAAVGYALTTAGTTEDTFDSQGNYNKTTWGTGDRITAAKLNKIEAGIEGVNQKVASEGTANLITLRDISSGETFVLSSNKPTIVSYTIVNNLSNAQNSNKASSIEQGTSYTGTITANNGYILENITVTMGGTDITSSSVSGNTITINSVTGNIVITVTTTQDSQEPGGGDSGGGTQEIVSSGLIKSLNDITSAQIIDNANSTYFDLNNSAFTVFAKCSRMNTIDNYATPLGGSTLPLTFEVDWENALTLTLKISKNDSYDYPSTSIRISTALYDEVGENLFIAVVGDKSAMKIYINNIEQSNTLYYAEGIYTPPTSIKVGKEGKNVTWLYYNRALTVDELTQNYTALGGVS